MIDHLALVMPGKARPASTLETTVHIKTDGPYQRYTGAALAASLPRLASKQDVERSSMHTRLRRWVT